MGGKERKCAGEKYENETMRKMDDNRCRKCSAKDFEYIQRVFLHQTLNIQNRVKRDCQCENEGGSDGEKMKMKIMRKWRTIARYKGEENRQKCVKNENIVLGLLVFTRGEREVMDIHTQGMQWEKERERKNRKENAKWQ